MAKNVRCKSRTDRSARSLAHQQPDILHIAAKAPRRRRTAEDEAEDVRRRIEHLECVITAAPAEHVARTIAMRDMVPPSDEHRARHAMRPVRRRTMEAQARARQRSMGLLVQSLVLTLVIAGVVGWLNQRFHFLHH